MPTLAEIDEALGHTSKVPLDARGAGWEAWVDALLDQRRAVVDVAWAEYECAIMAVPELR